MNIADCMHGLTVKGRPSREKEFSARDGGGHRRTLSPQSRSGPVGETRALHGRGMPNHLRFFAPESSMDTMCKASILVE